MKKCVILASMPVCASLYPYAQQADYLVAVDAGYKTAQEMHLMPHLLAGDFDSMPLPHTEIDTLVLPVQKDVTDTYFAAQKAVENGCTQVMILGGLGGRLDHTIANLHTLHFLAQQGVQAAMADENTYITMAMPHMPQSIAARAGWYLSVFPADSSAEGVTLRGTVYPLTDATLTNRFPLGVSNEFSGAKADISVKNGALFIFLARK